MGSDFLQVHKHDVVDGGSPLKNLAQVFLVASMPAGQIVRSLLRIAVRRVVTVMGCHVSEPVEDFQRIGVINDIHTFADIFFRHAVVVFEERDITVTHCRRRPAFLHLVAHGRKRTQVVGFRLFEALTAGMLARCHAPGVELLQ